MARKQMYQFNERWLSRLKPPIDTKQKSYWDARTDGLHVIVYKSGLKVYWVQLKGGSRIRLGEILGEGPDAQRRLEAGDVITLEDARDLAYQKRSPKTRQALNAQRTVQELYDLWIEDPYGLPSKKPKTRTGYIRSMKGTVLPVLGGLRLDELTPEILLKWIQSIGHPVDKGGRDSPVQANRSKSHLASMLKWARANNLIQTDPLAAVTWRYPESKKKTVYSTSEIGALWRDWVAHPTMATRLFRLVLCTIQRPGEIIAMKWADIETMIGGDVWVIEDPKNAVQHFVPLEPLAIEVLKEMKPLTGIFDHVFPHRDVLEGRVTEDQAPTPHMVAYNREIIRSRERTGIDTLAAQRLRATGASHMETAGVPLAIVQSLLNHTIAGATSSYVYSQGASPPCREAIAGNEEMIRACISGELQGSFAGASSE